MRAVRLLATLCATTALSRAALAEPAASEPGIWYRSADGCPEGQAFVERLSPRGVHARLATVGDRVDFVVTLGAADKGFAGRLERQTSNGVVAIRQFDASTCAEVADALALTLALSNSPDAAATEHADSAPAAAATRAPVTVVPEPERPETDRRAPAAAKPSPRVDRPPRASSSTAHSGWSLGAQGLVIGGLSPALLPAVGAFFEHAADGSGFFSPTFRLTGLVGRANGDTMAGGLEVDLLAARLEACPVQLAGDELALRSCVGADAGMLRAELERTGGRSASGTWLTLVAHPRFAWTAAPSLAVDAHAGISVPITRREMVLENASEPLHRTASVGFQAGIALAYRWR